MYYFNFKYERTNKLLLATYPHPTQAEMDEFVRRMGNTRLLREPELSQGPRMWYKIPFEFEDTEK